MLESERLFFQARIAAAKTRVAAAEVLVAGTELPKYQLMEVGDALSGPVMTVTGAGIQVDSEVSADDRRLLVVGLTARLIDG